MAQVLAQRFAQLLTEGVHRIRIRESKPVQLVQDELGYALGKAGGSCIEYWRKGHIPGKYADIECLARELVQRGALERVWLEQFLQSTDYPHWAAFCDDLFGQAPPLGHSAPPRYRCGSDGATAARSEFAPFIVGPPIIHPRHFFGRSYELKRIFDLWRYLPLQNVALIGPKRSGKTSFVHYLQQITSADPAQVRPGQRTDWLPQAQRYQWVLVDFRDPRMCNQEWLLRHLLTSLHLPVPDPCDLYSFIESVSTQLHTPSVILMDEIGLALMSPELDQRFWWSLRSLVGHQTGGNLGFLLTSQQSPAQLAQTEGKPSPFFNIFGHTFMLGPLPPAEALELIGSSPIPFAPSDSEWILTESRGWPCLLQLLCHARLTSLREGLAGSGWRDEALRQLAPVRDLVDRPFRDVYGV